MSESVRQQIMQSIQAAEALYHRLVVLVGRSGAGKTVILQEVANELGASTINVNLELSSRLLELTPSQQCLQASTILHEIVDDAPSPVFLDNIELLFDSNLQLNPWRLLQSVSRNQVIITSWNGSLIDGSLVYAEAEHSEYRKCDPEGALLVDMNNIDQDIPDLVANETQEEQA